MSRAISAEVHDRRSPLVERVEAEPTVEDRLDACLEPPDRKRLAVAARRCLANALNYGSATALVVYVTVHVWAVGSLVALLLGMALFVSTGQAIITSILSLVRLPTRPLTARGRRGYGWFLLTVAVEILEVAFGMGCLDWIGWSADWWGLLA